MKRFFYILLVSLLCIICIICCSCDSKEAINYEVAEKLNGTWATTWDSDLGEMANIYTFDYIGQDSGTCEFFNVWDGEVIVHYSSGTFMVKDGTITMDFLSSVDEYGYIEPLDSRITFELYYTYEDGTLTVKDDFRKFYQTEK